MIQVHLYGELRRYAEETSTSDQSVVHLPTDNGETVGSVLRQIGIDPLEVGQIFLNHQLLSTHCSMAPWLGYQSAEERIPPGGPISTRRSALATGWAFSRPRWPC